jgi:hypothetical protein
MFNSIKMHINRVHLKKSYECKECNMKFRKFQTMNHFWSHSFEHRGFMPYNCTKCVFKTAVLKTFKKHLVKEHKIKYDDAIHKYTKESYTKAIDLFLKK